MNFNKQTKIKSNIKYNISKDLSKRFYNKFNYKDTKFIIKQKNRLTNYFTQCAICNKKINKYNKNIDHIIPISKGGIDIEENRLLLCKKCNVLKSDLNNKKELFRLINNTKLAKSIKIKKKYAFNNILKYKKRLTIPKKYINIFKTRFNVIIPIVIKLLYTIIQSSNQEYNYVLEILQNILINK
tara:strand:- start:1146 stop:1697 length:552 start_codon:yes stop_codon:yes gene_type:complete